MRQSIPIIAFVLVLFVSTIGHTQEVPLTIRCYGSQEWAGRTIDLKIEIALPAKLDRTLSLLSPTKKEVDIIAHTPFGIGTIQINEQLGAAKSSDRYPFITTEMPDSEHSLIGFYLRGPHIFVIRADLWKKNKPFKYFDSLYNDFIHGTCN
jgi:hypothetical protein